MPTNHDELSILYKKISVLEMVEKLKACGTTWNKIGPVQYRVTYVEDTDVWDITLSMVRFNDLVVMDFSKNASFFYSLNSDGEKELLTLFAELAGDEEASRDQEILRDVSGFSGCR